MDEKDYINKMYDASLDSQKTQIQEGYDQAGQQLDEQKRKAQQQSDANLTRTYVEAEKARKNYAEVQNAYGLTSGAMAQARLAQDNQRAADMTAIRTQQQETDAAIERERGILAQEYASAIRQAQANNDLARAQALYEAAQREEERLLNQRENAAKLMAGQGDYRRLAEIYGLTEEELARITGKTGSSGGESGGSGGGFDGEQKENQSSPVGDAPRQTYSYGSETAAGYSDNGNYASLARIYGLTPEELWLLIGRAGS